MSRTVVLAAAISLALAACSGKESTAPVTANAPAEAAKPGDASTNPFMTVSSLPFQAPAFDKIKDSDYLPAFEEGMRQQ